MRYRRNAATVTLVGTVRTLVAGPRTVSKWLSVRWLLSPSRVRQRIR